MTFESLRLSPIRKPPAKTVAAASSQTGQIGGDDAGGRSRIAIQMLRPIR